MEGAGKGVGLRAQKCWFGGVPTLVFSDIIFLGIEDVKIFHIKLVR